MKTSRKRYAKLATTPKVDLSPLVALGFLLITFFIFSTKISKPKAIQIQTPFEHDDDESIISCGIREPSTLTLLLTSNHNIVYFSGGLFDPENRPSIDVVNINQENGVRNIILARHKEIANLIALGSIEPYDKLVIYIKPTDESTVADLIYVLDEMEITNSQIFSVYEPTFLDLDILKIMKNVTPNNPSS